jgi:hypothetical protein
MKDTANKPAFLVDLSNDKESALLALSHLSMVDPLECYHLQLDARLPLGIYNTSINRICDKIIKCSARLEKYFNASFCVNALRNAGDRHSCKTISSSHP